MHYTGQKTSIWSDNMHAGTSCNLTTSLTYNSVSLSFNIFWLIGRKCVHFINLTTITQIESWPFCWPRQVGHEVHGNTVPLPLRNIKRLQRTTRPLVFNLRFLTHQAGCHIICHIYLHTSPPKGFFQIFIHVSHTWMYAKMALMSLL